jgi:hypothetical protein
MKYARRWEGEYTYERLRHESTLLVVKLPIEKGAEVTVPLTQRTWRSKLKLKTLLTAQFLKSYLII